MSKQTVNSRVTALLATILLILGIYLILRGLNPEATNPSSTTPSPPPPQNEQTLGTTTEVLTLVTEVIDGDTIEIESGEKVRLIGIDTPETVDPRRPVGCFGPEASDKAKELMEGRLVKLEKDVSEKDKFNRLLRYIYVDQLFINEYLVREGFAHASSFPPDIRYQNLLNQAEGEAKINQKGLWSSCPNK